MALLEIAAFHLESAIMADAAGADRVELCADQKAGGVTPALHLIAGARSALSIPFFVMIRPRGGDFYYNAAEYAIMRESLLAAKALGAQGFVFGLLTADGLIDEVRNATLVKLAAPLPCTFHRAFDDVADKQAGLERLIRCGFRRVLTSGGVGQAPMYPDELARLVAQGGTRITVMPGGGVRPANIGPLMEATGAIEYHSAAMIEGGKYADADTILELCRAIHRSSGE